MSTHDIYVDTNIGNYTLSELMAIVELNDLDPEEIVLKTNKLVNKFKNLNPELSAFFIEVRSQLLQYSQGLIVNKKKDKSNKIVVETYQNMNDEDDNTSDAEYPSAEQQTNNWYENEYPQQSDKNQTDKITNRQQKIQVYGNQQVPMNKEQIATTDTYNLPVKQDSLNPNLKNTINRFVNLDSQFRQATSGPGSSAANYTLDLSDTLKDAISICLYSYQVPQSWYVIDKYYGNTCFWIINGEFIIPITITSGNYNQTSIQTELESAFINAGFSGGGKLNSDGDLVHFIINPINAKITFYFGSDTTYNGSDGSFTISEETRILFYDFSGKKHCENNCYSKTNNYLNDTLGWILGFRLPYVDVLEQGNEAPAIINLNGTKYLILVIDDYNQNHVNNSLVSISQFNNTLKLPSYYTNDLIYTCAAPQEQSNNLKQLIAGVTEQSTVQLQTTNPLNGLLIGEKYDEDYLTTQQIVTSAPRQLTQSQIHTINEINKNRNSKSTRYLAKAPTSGDILGIIPVKTSTVNPTGSQIVEFSGSLQSNKRNYFGPVDIDRMAVKLLDDKGNILNLNGSDWCVTLICECLYQY
jgi:hypothetical protein